jgi:protoporphyrinogen oxidase
VWTGTEAVRLDRDGGRITGVVAQRDGEDVRISADQVISSMPLPELIQRVDGAPADVEQSARGLRYRDFVLVGLIANRPDPFPDNWIYVHDPAVRVGRSQNFRNWSAAMVPDAGTASLGMEYFCTEGDEVWRMADGDLINLATRELAELGLAEEGDVVDGLVIRQPKAYPLYDEDYAKNLRVVRSYLGTMDNLQSIGRNGLHRYNNMDHSMLTGLRAIDNVRGGDHDLWAIGDDLEYLEQS